MFTPYYDDYADEDDYDQEDHPELWHAASRYDWKEVRRLIDFCRQSVQIEVHCEEYGHEDDKCIYSLLHFAVEDPNSTIELIDYLISRGVSLVTFNARSISPLALAAKLGRFNIVKHLIERHNIDTKDVSQDEYTLLHYATLSNNLQLVQYIMSHPNMQYMINQCPPGLTKVPPLAFAAKSPTTSLELIKYMVDNGAIIYDDVITDIVFVKAIKNPNITIFDYLMEKANFKDESIKTKILHDCCIASISTPVNGFNNTKHLLDQYHVERTIKDQRGFPIIHQLMRLCSIEDKQYHSDIVQFIQYLNLSKEELNYRIPGETLTTLLNIDTATPLVTAMLTADEMSLSLIQILVHLGMEITNVDGNGSNLLHIYCSRHNKGFKSNQSILKYLTSDLNLRVEATNNKGQTALHYTALHGSGIETPQYLINNKAQIDLPDNDGNTPLLLSFNRSSQDQKVIQLLLQKGANIQHKNKLQQNVYHLMASSGSDSLSTYSNLTTQVNPNEIDSNGNTPFLLSCTSRLTNVKWFIGKNANIHHINNFNQNALHFAIQSNNALVPQYLCEQRIDPNVIDINGETPLTLALIKPIEESLFDLVRVANIKCVYVLLQYQADPQPAFQRQLPLLPYIMKSARSDEDISTSLSYLLFQVLLDPNPQ